MAQWLHDENELRNKIKDGMKARAHYPHKELGFPDDYEDYLEGTFTIEPIGPVFHPTDAVFNGVSHQELTGTGPSTGPQRLSYMLSHGVQVELL